MSPAESQSLFALLLGLFIPLCCFHQASALLNSTAQSGSQWTVQAPGGNLTIIANDNFSLVLSFMESSPCVLSVQHIPSGLHVWIANFKNNAGVNASQNCSLVLQQDGDLQLKDDGKASWSSGTGSRGVRELQLLETGNLVLVNSTFANVTQDIVWQSFEHPSDTLITGQKLPYGVIMVAASDANAYRAGNVYSMELSNHFSDLMLYADFGQGSGPQQYWSMAEIFTPPANAWVCCWASYLELSNGLTIFDNQSAAGLSTSSSSTTSQVFEYARLESDGNLRTYIFKGGSWQLNFQALTRLCQYPDACGPYGVCSSTFVDVCSGTCLPSFHLLNSSNPSQGCTSSSLPSVYECPSNASDIVMLNATGYTYFSAQGFYMSAELAPDSFTSTVDECGMLCLQNCSCQGAFFTVEGCYLMNHPIGTVQQNNDNRYTAFIKLANDSNLLAPAPAPLQERGNSPSLLPALPGPQLQTSNGDMVRVFAGVFSSSAAIAVIILGLGLWYVRTRRKAQQNADDEMFLDTLPGLPPRYTYRDLHEATKGFSKKLGAGGFGAVYEGVLPHDNSRVAVKQLKDAHRAGIKQFRAEVATLGKISHINLVKLCGYCLEGSHRLLVYEFMDKQSLDRALFHVEADVLLDLKTRYAIAQGTAKGLAYLHEECTNRIIHCDIKPENILLDQHWVPKVADFGLAKPMDREQSHVVTTLRGTRGYLAPEWLKNAPITEKADVFSYGIVLLELVAGRRSFELCARAERCYLPAWAFDVLEKGEDLMVLADERLHTEIMGKQEEEQKIIRMVKVALWCAQEDPCLRPAMSSVMKFLEGETEIELPPVTHFFARARPHEDDLESAGETCGSVNVQEASSMSHLQSQLSWEISTLVSGR